MGLTSEQASIIAARPRINPVEEEQMVRLFAEGRTTAEVHLQFPQFAQGTIANLKTRKKEQVNELQRMITVQFEDIPTTRKQARLDGLWNLYRFAVRQLRLLEESSWVIDGETGETREIPVDGRLAKPYADMIFKALRHTAEETGQLPQRVEGLDEKWTPKLLGLDGNSGVDYPALVEAQAQWEAGAPLRAAKRAQEKAARDQWFDEDWVASMVRGGTSRKLAIETVHRYRDRKNGLSPEEVKRRVVERFRAAQYAEDVENLETICEESVTQDLDGNPKHLDAEGLERERVHLKKYWFPDDEAAHARVDCFFDGWRYPDAEDVDEVPVVAASQNDEPVPEEKDVDVEVWRVMPPLKSADEPEPDPEPEPDQVGPLREAFIQALADGRAADPDELVRELKCSAAEFFAVLAELIDGVVVEDGTRIQLAGSSVAVA
jgi:hypothetical protein